MGVLQSNLFRAIGPWVVSRLIPPVKSPQATADSNGDAGRLFGTRFAMELTAEILRRIVDSPADSAAADLRAEREQRRTPRTRLNLQVTLMPFSEHFASDNVVAPLRDLSRGGFGFLSDRSVPLGEQFAMLLPEVSSGRPIVVLCTVTYWQPLDDNLYSIGARFCRVLRQGEVGLPLILEDATSGEISAARLAS